MILHYFRLALAVLSLAGIGYYIVAIFCAARFLRWRRKVATAQADFTPAFSILKPVRGADANTLEAFRSHCAIDYPEYEIIFGVNNSSDPAVPLIRQLITEFPQRKIKLVVSSEVLGANQKVSNLMQILPHASHDLLIVNDGDIRVAQDYVSRIAPFFSGEKTGLVTCLYRGVASKTLSSKLESLGISTDFAAGVLVAHSLEGGISFGLGSTLAFKRSALDQIGGFAALADYLADDYEIGRRIHHAGYKVELADFAVETFISPYSFGGFFRHQIRWARTIRDARPAGYAGLLFTFGLPWAMLCAVAAMGAPWSVVLLTIAVTARLAVAILVGQAVLNDSSVLPNLLWLPLRDLLALGVWFASFFGNKIWWGETDYILKRGKLAPAARS